MIFGIYPGGATGDDTGGLATGAPDDPARVSEALDRLQGRAGRPFLVRAYTHYEDGDGGLLATATPADAERYAVRGRRLDLVAQYRSASGDVAGYRAWLRALVERYGTVTDTLQVTEEPNVVGNPTLDGDYPGVREAIVTGVRTVKEHARALGHTHLRTGFNTTPLFGPATGFVADLVREGGEDFTTALDYIGLDFFPDVFRPVPAAAFDAAVSGLLRHHREAVLGPAGLADLPLHLTEHGWPTGPGRGPERQAEIVGTVVRLAAAAPGIAAYTHFALRDADSARPGLFHRFGLMTDTYAPKPAFDVLRGLVERHG
ncbi:hypothetical protein RM574_03940 [Streptomyces sp. DSM 41982]|uniref:Uncharacterized protein n=1 Tax=Streptomyces evansiae TaxID=3075535 RepID=A0ABD5DZJ1_9ACTN|nr:MULTISPECIES: hypothetical protein [unclassified Streptomyces]MDT0414631.1 hypothetical protein [Streptomyces sp. DSM 41982]SCD36132.1 hypothetical protein GA0115246_100783 [Streptomyces sp. SolWspMP-sol7th]